MIVIYFILTILLFVHLWQKNDQSKINIPGPKPVPFFGNLHEFFNLNHHQIFLNSLSFFKIYGDTIRFYLGNRLFVALTDPRDAELILGSHEHINKPKEYQFFQPWLGNGLLISEGEKWSLRHLFTIIS
jgi:cytochrome P450 family 4